jgi:phosphoribosylformylglycinamidine (FGAM) synthase-like enzyme
VRTKNQKKPPLTPYERVKIREQKNREEGQERLTVWIHPEHVEKFKKILKENEIYTISEGIRFLIDSYQS